MKRRKLIQSAGVLSAAGVVGSIAGCKSTPVYYQAQRSDSGWLIPKSELSQGRGVVIETSGFPVGVYQTGEDSYVASVMECTHQSCKTVLDDGGYICPCHGSRFSAGGEVLKGPAKEPLNTRPIKDSAEHIEVLLN